MKPLYPPFRPCAPAKRASRETLFAQVLGAVACPTAAVYGAVLLVLMAAVACSGQRGGDGTGHTDDPTHADSLAITLDGAWARATPTDGEVLAKLPLNTVCPIVRRGKKETIKGVTDYWYQVVYQGQKAWVFGAQTTKRAGDMGFSMPQAVDYRQALPEGMCQQPCLVVELLPIGWAANGDFFAYATQPENEAIGGYDFTITIQNMATDKPVWYWEFKEHKTPNWDGSERESLATVWQKNEGLFAQKLAEYGIQPLAKGQGLQPLPAKIGARVYYAEVTTSRTNAEMFGVPVIRQEAVFVQFDGAASKQVFEKKYEDYAALLETAIAGVIVGPGQSRAALIKASEKRGYEGPPNVLAPQVIGFHLTKGF